MRLGPIGEVSSGPASDTEAAVSETYCAAIDCEVIRRINGDIRTGRREKTRRSEVRFCCLNIIAYGRKLKRINLERWIVRGTSVTGLHHSQHRLVFMIANGINSHVCVFNLVPNGSATTESHTWRRRTPSRGPTFQVTLEIRRQHGNWGSRDRRADSNKRKILQKDESSSGGGPRCVPTSTLAAPKSLVPIPIEYVIGRGLGAWIGVGPEKEEKIVSWPTRMSIGEEVSKTNVENQRIHLKFMLEENYDGSTTEDIT